VSIIQLREAAGNLDRAQLAEINGWLSVSAPTSPPVETPESLTPKLPPAPPETNTPVTPQSVLPPPGKQQPAGRDPNKPQ
jgi:hypothetical protein